MSQRASGTICSTRPTTAFGCHARHYPARLSNGQIGGTPCPVPCRAYAQLKGLSHPCRAPVARERHTARRLLPRLSRPGRRLSMIPNGRTTRPISKLLDTLDFMTICRARSCRPDRDITWRDHRHAHGQLCVRVRLVRSCLTISDRSSRRAALPASLDMSAKRRLRTPGTTLS